MELLKIRTDQFEGPLDLMLFLIQKHELNVSEISIHRITDQYLQYVNLMRELNFDLASEFLVMAATLILMKSRRLLPGDEDAVTVTSEDAPPSEAELVRRLREYQMFQDAAKQLIELPMFGRDVLARPNVPPMERQTVWKEMDLTTLTVCFQDVLRRSRKRNKIIIREPTSIPERIRVIGNIMKVGEMTEFASLLSEDPTRTEVIVTFIALLEIARLKKLKVYQNETFGSIYLTLTQPLTDLDPTMMTGFQYQTKKDIEELSVHV